MLNRSGSERWSIVNASRRAEVVRTWVTIDVESSPARFRLSKVSSGTIIIPPARFLVSRASERASRERILRLAFGIRFLGRPGFSHGQVYQESGSPADKLVIRGRRVSSSVNIDRITVEGPSLVIGNSVTRSARAPTPRLRHFYRVSLNAFATWKLQFSMREKIEKSLSHFVILTR